MARKVGELSPPELASQSHIAHAVRIAMAIKNMSLIELSARSGITNTTLGRFVGSRNANTNPQLRTVLHIAKALDMSLEDLINLPGKAKDLLN